MINYLVHCRQKVLEPLPLVVEHLPQVVKPLPLVVYLPQSEGLVHNLETGKQTFLYSTFFNWKHGHRNRFKIKDSYIVYTN